MSPHRLAAQTMLWRALRTLVQSFAPMLPHLAEDVFQEAPILFTHGSTFTHSEQSAKEFGSSIFHFGMQHPALYSESSARTLTDDQAADISESYRMVAGAARQALFHPSLPISHL
jgi:isoleucyl-tRNA synthetase